MLIKLYVAARAAPDRVAALLARYRADAAARRDRFAAIVADHVAARPPARHEHETAGPDLKVILAASNRQFTFEHVERLVLMIVDVKRGPALHGDFEHAQRSICGVA